MAATVEEVTPKHNVAPTWIIKSDKFNHEFRIEKSFDGFVFFKVSVSSGTLPKELSGYYTKAPAAIKAVLEYEFEAKPTATVQRDHKADARKKQKEAS